MSLDQESRRQIIKSFRGYCKGEKWGKVNAAKALAAHLYPDGESGSNAQKRAGFVDGWSDRIEDVLYKKSTILSNFKDAELADYIYSFLLDNIGNDQIGINSNLFERHLAIAFGDVDSLSTDSIFGKATDDKYFEIKSGYQSSLMSLQKHADNIYKCNIVFQNRVQYKTKGTGRKYHESVRKHPINYMEEDINVVTLSGMLYSNSGEFISLDGLVTDSLKRTVLGVKISIAEYTMPSRAIHPNDISGSVGVGFIRIETSIPYFPKTHTRIESDRVFMAGNLSPYDTSSCSDEGVSRGLIEQRLINQLKSLCES